MPSVRLLGRFAGRAKNHNEDPLSPLSTSRRRGLTTRGMSMLDMTSNLSPTWRLLLPDRSIFADYRASEGAIEFPGPDVCRSVGGK